MYISQRKNTETRAPRPSDRDSDVAARVASARMGSWRDAGRVSMRSINYQKFYAFYAFYEFYAWWVRL